MQIFLLVKQFGEVGDREHKFKNPLLQDAFQFVIQNFSFLRGWVLFWGNFLVIFLSFFHAKFQFFAGMGDLFE